MPLQIEYWPIGRLKPYEKNPRKNDQAVARMVASIQEFGFAVPILARSSGEVVDGHLRLKAALQLKLTEVPVIICDGWSEAQVKAFRIMVNRSVTWADWDKDALAMEFGELKAMDFDLGLTGFDINEIERYLPPASDPNEDEVPPVPEAPVSRRGDLWLMGEHRLLCGDSTSAEDVGRLFAGIIPDLCLTDPPYGLSIVKAAPGSERGVGGGAKPYGKNEGVGGGGGSAGAMYPYGGKGKGVVGGANIVRPRLYSQVVNDDSTETARSFYTCCQSVGVENFIIFGGNFFADFLPVSRCWVIWDKQNSGNFADAELAWTSFDRGAKLYQHMWNGLSREGTREVELATRVHPTQKPVGLFTKIFEDFASSVVYDGFLGSGSVLIAAELTGRRCFGLEIAPEYCDVIVTRWEKLTGKQATLDGIGATFAHVRDGRRLEAQDALKEEALASTSRL